MNTGTFIKGAAVGLIVGSAVGAMMVPQKSGSKKRAVGRAIKSVGEVVENFTDFIGM